MKVQIWCLYISHNISCSFFFSYAGPIFMYIVVIIMGGQYEEYSLRCHQWNHLKALLQASDFRQGAGRIKGAVRDSP